MRRDIAVNKAIELTKLAIQSYELKSCPSESTANTIADFIQTLAKRLEALDDGSSI